MSKDTKMILLLIFTVSTMFTFMMGTIDSIANREMGRDGCEMKSISAYFPGHYIACELFRSRF